MDCSIYREVYDLWEGKGGGAYECNDYECLFNKLT